MDPDVWRWIWLAVTVAALVGEMLTSTFFLLPFALGAALACVLAFLGAPELAQWLVFVAASAAGVYAFRPLARRLDRNDSALPRGVGASRWVGQTGTVLRAIDAHDGLVKIGGEDWRASSRDDVVIPAGSRVLVTGVEGTRLLVLPLELGQGGTEWQA
ncbi:MAG TPA: NfeD family protein [Acidimicrobiales bacterium]|nr:NfeD family protein [Acidimicrobiales bacterium]